MTVKTAAIPASDKGHSVNIVTDSTGDKITLNVQGVKGGIVRIVINSIDALMTGGDAPISVVRVG
jgi:hypothetical protein